MSLQPQISAYSVALLMALCCTALVRFNAAQSFASASANPTQALQPQLPSHDMFFNAFDGTRFAFPVFHKGIFTLLSHADHLVRLGTLLQNVCNPSTQINAVFIDRGAGQPLMTGVAVRYKKDLQVFAATLASAKHPNGAPIACVETVEKHKQIPSVSMTVLVNEKRLEVDSRRSLLPVGQDCEVLLDHRSTGDQRLVIQTPFLTVYVLKYADSANIDMHIDTEEAMGEVRLECAPEYCSRACILHQVHGILGQTLPWIGMQGSARTLEGDETRYVASSIFADDAKCNLFKWGDTKLDSNL